MPMHQPNRWALPILVLSAVVMMTAQPSLPKGWTVDGSGPQITEITRTCDEAHGGRCSVRLSSEGARALGGFGPGFGALAQRVSAAEFAGRRVALSGWLKTVDAKAARLWLRADAGATIAGFDNMDDRPVVGTEPWTRYTLAIDVPQGASALAFGVLLTGAGSAWGDDLELTIVDEREVPSTDILPRDKVFRGLSRDAATMPRRPVNLGFEE
jgi:hypothetical protein